MKFFSLILLCVCLLSYSKAQQPTAKKSVVPVDTVTVVDPNKFSFKNKSYKKRPNRGQSLPLKLGVKNGKLYVIDSLGKVQPYKILSFSLNVTVARDGGVGTIETKAVGNSLNCPLVNESKPGSYLCFEEVVVSDKDRKVQRGIVEGLCVQQIKK